MEVRLLEDYQDLCSLKQAWAELLPKARADDYFLHPLWVMNWWRLLGEKRNPWVITCWKNGDLQAVVPLYANRTKNFRVVRFAGQPIYSDRMDFVLSRECEAECLEAITGWLLDRKDWDLIYLRDFGVKTDIPEKLNACAQDKGFRTVIVKETPAFAIKMVNYAGFDDYFNRSFSGKTRKNIKKAERNAAGTPGWKMDVKVIDDPSIFDEMADLARRNLNMANVGTGFFLSHGNTDLLKTIVEDPFYKDDIIGCLATIDGQLVGYEIDFKHRNALLGYQTAYDRRFRHLSLGNLIFFRILQYAFDNGFHEYDFLKGDETYKSSMTDTQYEARRLLIFNQGWRSSSLYAYQRIIKPLRGRIGRSRYLPGRIRGKWDL